MAMAEVAAATTNRDLQEGVGRGKYRSNVDAREPQKPPKSEEYQRQLQGGLCGTQGAQSSKTL
eukprot:8597612-Pyramimonas_sp.AAC.1